MQQESLDLMDELGLPSDVKLATVSRGQQLGRRIASPAQIEAVKRGCWIVVMTISGSALLCVLKQYLHPVVLEAWNQSDIRERLLEFLQDPVFKSAARKAELKAVERLRYGNIQVTGVDDDSKPAEPSLTVHLERHAIVEVRAVDDLLIDEFLEKLTQGRQFCLGGVRNKHSPDAFECCAEQKRDDAQVMRRVVSETNDKNYLRRNERCLYTPLDCQQENGNTMMPNLLARLAGSVRCFLAAEQMDLLQSSV